VQRITVGEYALLRAEMIPALFPKRLTLEQNSSPICNPIKAVLAVDNTKDLVAVHVVWLSESGYPSSEYAYMWVCSRAGVFQCGKFRNK